MAARVAPLATLAPLAIALVACGPGIPPTAAPPEVPARTSGCVDTADTGAETTLALAPEVAESIDGVREAVSRAVAGDWAALEARLAPEVGVLREPGTDTTSLVRLDAVAAGARLRERWRPGIEIRGSHIVEHRP